MNKPDNNSPEITMLFDGECPLCSREVAWLQRRNQGGKVGFIDISQKDFSPERFGLTRDEVDREIHGVLPDGTVVRRVEVFRRIYRAIGLGWLVAPTAWPLLRPCFDFAYRVFARNRKRLGRLFPRRCATDKCGL